jgi:hypothetical protein
MARVIAVDIQEGEGHRPVDGVEIDGRIGRRCEKAQERRQQIKQRCRDHERCQNDRESRHQAIGDPQDFAHHILKRWRILTAGHGRDKALIFAAVSRLCDFPLWPSHRKRCYGHLPHQCATRTRGRLASAGFNKC